MLLEINEYTAVVHREPGDRFRRDRPSTFLYHVVKAFKDAGYDAYKKKMYKKGYLVYSHIYGIFVHKDGVHRCFYYGWASKNPVHDFMDEGQCVLDSMYTEEV